MKPLVSILIPAYNAQEWIPYSVQSAIAQTWERKEIIVLDDGSTDRTAEVARRFASSGVKVVSTENHGVAAARNQLAKLSQGDYIQWLDADDLLAPDKIEMQLASLKEGDSRKILLSSPWAQFYYRTRCARFVPNSLWFDLSPVEWLLRKMGQNLHMQTATWLTSRELADAAGPWDNRLVYDEDGEYFARVLVASEGTRFVPESKVFYRVTDTNRVSYVGNSDKKKDSLILSMKYHIQYIQLLENSERVRTACLTYMQAWYPSFYPERPKIVAELKNLAEHLRGHLEVPRLRRKYAWMRPILGWKAAKWAQNELPHLKIWFIRRWEKAMFGLEGRGAAPVMQPHSSVKNERPFEHTAPSSIGMAETIGRPWAEVKTGNGKMAKASSKPLVSILIPAYNAEEWVAESIRSALAQTWERKEIIVVDDGSRDQTAEVARRLESKGVKVVTTENQGAAAARNYAIRLCQGDYIQWLDADDLLAPDKIERQLGALEGVENKKILLSSPWAYFNYRTRRALFTPTSLCQDLSPLDWLMRKMGENLHMQTGTWLTSRELIEAAGFWDTRLLSDDDGEFYCRVLLASKGTRFVPEAKLFYRITQTSRLSHVGSSDKKKDALLISMKLHIRYIRSLEESERVRRACLTYMQNWYPTFYPERQDIVSELQALATELGGRLEPPRLRWKYAWMSPIFGRKAAKQAQITLPQLKASVIRSWDKAMYRLETRGTLPSKLPVMKVARED